MTDSLSEAQRTEVIELVERAIAGKGRPLAKCVDDQIVAELERKWDRNDPPNPFGVLEKLKKEDQEHWVSPEVSLRMFAMVEYLARLAINEATRA